MNSAHRARLKQSRKNTKKGKEIALHTRMYRKASTYWMRPRSLKKKA